MTKELTVASVPEASQWLYTFFPNFQGHRYAAELQTLIEFKSIKLMLMGLFQPLYDNPSVVATATTFAVNKTHKVMLRSH